MPNILVSSYEVGLELDREPEFIPETAFPQMINAYAWRGRVRRRYGNAFLGRLRREISGISLSNLDGSGDLSDNIFTKAGITETNASLDLGSLVVTISGGTTLAENSPSDGELSVTAGALTLTSSEINYATGALTLDTDGSGNTVSVAFSYYPAIPVMGLPQRDTEALNFEENWGFDTTYAYVYNQTSMDYEEVASALTTTWHGDDFNLFWTTNYEGALWTTNNIDGFHFYTLSSITQANPGVFTTTATHNLSVDDPVVILAVDGMVEVNAKYYLVNTTPAPTTFTLKDATSGTALDTTLFSAYSAAGVVHTPTQNVGAVDGIRYYQPDVTPTWVNFNPPISTVEALTSCLLLFSYRGRMVALRTREGLLNTDNQTYNQRARWSQNGTPYYSSPNPTATSVDEEAWRDDLVGRGGFVDAPTAEWIVGAGFVRDTLIVAFERSTWRLRYTGNEYQPFQWERVNTELGIESTFSIGLFDKGILGVGDRGIISSNGVDTERIDKKIPDEVFVVNNNENGKQRVYGSRDFIRRLFYWSYPEWSTSATQKYPNRVFVLNYEEGSWAKFTDSITCFGEFQNGGDLTWALTAPDEQAIMWSSAGYTWGSGIQQQQAPQPLVGNQHGYVQLFQQKVSDSRSLQITAITAADPGILTIPSHNLEDGYIVQVINVISGATTVTAGVGTLADINDQVFKIDVIDDDTIYIKTLVNTAPTTFTRAEIAGTYLGGGEIIVRANFLVRSKRFNPFLKDDSKVRLTRTDFFTDATAGGEFTYELYQDTNRSLQINRPYDPLNTRSDVILTQSSSCELEDQEKSWFRNMDNCDGQFFQFLLTLSDQQMLDDGIQSSDFVLHAMNFSVEKSGRLV